MSDDKHDIRREWVRYITSREQDRDLGVVQQNPFGAGVPDEWAFDPEAWDLDPIVVRPGGRIEALRLDPISRDVPFGLPPEDAK